MNRSSNLSFRKGRINSLPSSIEYLDRDREFKDLYSIGAKQGRKNMFKTPEKYYRGVSNKISPDSIERRTEGERKQMYNPKTSKWIQDTGQNRSRIKTYKKSQKPKLSLVRSSMPIESFNEDDIEYFLDDYSDLPEYMEPETLIDPRIPDGTLNSEYCKDKYKNNLPVDLNKVKYDLTELPGIDNSMIFLGENRGYPMIHIDTIPALLEYEGKKLNVIEYISRGSFGTVLRYSEETPLIEGWQIDGSNEFGTNYININTGKQTNTIPRQPNIPYYELAVKTYSNQTDGEITLINDLNNDGKSESDVGMCNTVNTKILENNSGEKFAIMDLMDGTLSDLIKDKLTITQAIEITLDITKSFKCLLDKGFSYTDLKSANVLYKCYKDIHGDGHIKVVLGDIGSICKKSKEREPIWTSDFYITEAPVSDGGVATYPPPESIDDAANTPCNENTMSWDIGVILLELLGYDTINEFYWGSTLIKQCVSTYENADVCFLNYIRNMTLPKINELYNLDDIILYGIPNIGNITLYDLLKNIMDKKERRINLEQIINGLNNQPY